MKELFHNSVTDSERKALRGSDLFRPALHLVTQTPDNVRLLVSSVTVQSDGIFVDFATGYGVPMLRLTNMRGANFTASIYDGSGQLSYTTVASSERPMYLAKALLKDTKAGNKMVIAWHNAHRVEKDMVFSAVRNAHTSMVDNRRTAMNYRDMITSEQIGTLLRVFFGETLPLNVSTEYRQAFEAVRAERDKRRAMRMDVFERMKEMFGTPKWFVSYLPGHGYTVRGVNVSETWERIIQGDQAVRDLSQYFVITHPAQFHRSLDELVPEIRDGLLATLTLNKMHMQGKYSHLHYDTEPNDLLPYVGNNGVVVSNELSSILIQNNDLRVIMVSQ